MRSLLLITLLGATACYQPRFSSGQFKCDQPGDTCPPGLVCADGRCLDPREVPPDQATGAPPADMSADLTADMSLGPDADLRMPPDLSVDLRPPTACVQVGREAGRDIVACKATFANGNLTGICPLNYRVCTRDDDNLLGVAAAGTACGSAGGFYAARIRASIKMNGDVDCEAQTEMSGWALVGCGSEVLAANPGMNGTRVVSNDCKKLKVVLPCRADVKGWTCTTGLQDASHMNIDRGGLLCCKLP